MPMKLTPEIQQQLGPMERGRVQTAEGVTLDYQTFGSGPLVVFANGIGVRYQGGAHQIEALRHRHRVLCWDYRGMGRSTMADAEGDVSMAAHARDLLALLDHLGEERAVIVGWSMGVQVGLETIRLAPQRVAGFVPMMGTFSRPFHTGLPSPVGHLVEGLFAVGRRFPPLAQAVLDLAVAAPPFTFAVLSTARFVGRDADPAVFAANVANVQKVEKRHYLRTMLALGRHDATDLLPAVRCPTLVICAQHDYLTPPRMARRMAEAIPGAEFRVVQHGTHFALAEQPELINTWLCEFVERVYN